jgi:stage V sporulation protein G
MKTVDVEVVDIRKAEMGGKVKALADVKTAGGFLVKGLSVVQGKRGMFVSMPRKFSKEGEWFDVVMPLNEDLRQAIQDKVLEAYDRETDGVKS